MSGHLAINWESGLGLAAVLVLLWRTKAGGDAPSRPSLRLDGLDALSMLSIALLIAAAFWRAIRIPFLSDDYVLVSLAQSMPQTFSGNYGPLFTHGGGDGFFRPLGYLSLAWTWPWAGWNPTGWHLAALLAHLGSSWLVYVLAGALGLSRSCRWLASALFAWHGANPEAVVWIAGRFDVLATFFALLALAAFIKCWEESSPGWGAAAWIAMGLGMLSKESAYAVPLAMLVYVTLRPAGWSRRIRYLVPFFLLAGALFAYRWALQGGIGGYLGPGGQPQALSLDPLEILKALALRLWAVLFFPVNWSVPAGMWLPAAAGLHALVWLAVAMAVKGSRSRILIPLGFTIAMALPPVQQLLIGADLEKSRLVYLPSAGFCLLAATVVGMTGPNLRRGAGLAMLAFSLAALLHNLTGWEAAGVKAKTVCEAVAKCSNPTVVEGLPRSLNGVYFFANGLPECVRMERERSPGVALHACSLHWDQTAGDQAGGELRPEPPE